MSTPAPDDEVSDYVPFWIKAREVEPEPEQRPTTAETRSSYLLAVLPALALAVDVWMYSSGSISWVQIVMVAGVFDFAAVGLAAADQKRLWQLRITKSTSPWLALFAPPVYLFVRGTRAWREVCSGYGPAWLSLAVGVITAFVLYELPGIVTVLQGLNGASGAY